MTPVWMERFLRAWEGPSNSGTVTMHNFEAPSRPHARILNAVARAAERHERQRQNGGSQLLTREQRKRAADTYREQADRIERA